MKSQAQEALETLEAERLIETVRLRSDLIKAARDLLPEAIAQAKPKKNSAGETIKPGSPALLRLIARLAMRDVSVDRKK